MSLSDFVTMYFWLFLALMLGATVYAIVKAVRWGHYRDFAVIESWPEILLRRGYDGGYYAFVHEPTGQSFEFRKYIRAKGDYGLELRVHNLDWLVNIVEKSKAVAESVGLPFRVEESRTKDGVRGVLVIDCRQDSAAAYQLGRSIWTRVFELSDRTPFQVYCVRLSSTDELIDGPDHPPHLHDLPSSEYLKELERRLLKPKGLTITTGCLIGLVPIVWWNFLVAFLIAMILSRGDAPDWYIQLGQAGLGGSTVSLIFLLLHVLFFALMLKFRKMSGAGSELELPNFLNWSFPVMYIMLLFPTVLAWSGY